MVQTIIVSGPLSGGQINSDTVAMSSLPRDQIVKAIAQGGASVNKSALMPTWGGVLTDQEIEDMADYLLYVCKCDQGK